MLDTYADRWALVTGASSGIGAEFARRLAARGMHLVLVARREDRLRELAEELDTRHGTQSVVLPADLSEPGAAKRVLDEVRRRGLSIELLVNNAGFAVVDSVENTDPQRVQEMLRLNVAAATELVYGVLPAMLQREHGAILNVASVAGFQPVAYMGAYAATKAYLLHFSEALWAEVRDRGVTVTALCPGVTKTEFFDVAGVGGWLKKQVAQTPEEVVKSALKALEKRRQFLICGWKARLTAAMVRMASRKVVVTESMKYFRPTTQTAEDAPPPNAEGDAAESPPSTDDERGQGRSKSA